MEAVILANGEFPQDETALRALTEAEHLVCCDGAAERLAASGIREPGIIVGDLDSLPADMLEDGENRIVQVSEQDTNDLQKAFRYCLAQGWRHILILGATGYREDHTLGNISLLADFGLKCPDIRMMTDYGEFRCVTGTQEIPSWKGQQISIFSLCAGQQISSVGLKYNLDGIELNNLWQGTLNECLGDSFTLTVNGGNYPVLVYLNK